MKKKAITFYCIIFMLFCQYPAGVMAITEKQGVAISDNCSQIRESLRKVQKQDSKVRVYLGGYYEAILSKFITPLNIRLVENNLSTAGLIENQNDFATAKALFVNDFVSYQQGLEDLVNFDCDDDSDGFYDKLTIVRQKRETMTQDVLRLRSLISQHIRLVEGLKGKV